MELFALVREGRSEDVRKLLSGPGAAAVLPFIDIQNENGQTPLYWACERKTKENFDIVGTLIEKGADVNLPESHGFTPLHLACYVGNIQVANLLLAGGANVNQTNHSKSTALHLAAKNNHYEVVKILLNNGANIRARDDSFKLPLAYSNDDRITRLLQNAMARGRPRSNSASAGSGKTITHTTTKTDSTKTEMPNNNNKSPQTQKDPTTTNATTLLQRVAALEDQIANQQKTITSLKDQLEEEQKKDLCIHCDKTRRDTVLVPCMHLLYCWECATRLPQQCGYCDTPIEGMLRVTHVNPSNLECQPKAKSVD
jgi:hypothetical protein